MINDFEAALVKPAQEDPTHAPVVHAFYRPEMVSSAADRNFSRSPQKPRLLMEQLTNSTLAEHLHVQGDFLPFEDEEFLTAHTPKYVTDFFSGRSPAATSNNLHWTNDFAQSVRFTNSSLYQAVRHAAQEPETICFSPTSGFHHATPACGGGFCTFSGQVIASTKIFREFGMSGAYIDLDGHFGNSIEESRSYVPDLDQAVPSPFNINPTGRHESYLADLRKMLARLQSAILSGSIHYVVVCHGADSHYWDDLGIQCTTEEWIECSRMVYGMIRETSLKLGRPLPTILSLFGGYRSDDYTSVLNLHTGDLVVCLNTLCGHCIEYEVRVLKNRSH